MVDYCIAEGVSALLIAGDLFDRAERSAKTAAYLTLQMERLQKSGVRVFYIKGNHDAENPITGEIDLPACVHVFDGRGGKVQVSTDVWVHGVSFRDKHAPDSLLPKFGAPEPGAINIAMLHTSLSGTVGHDLYAPCAVADLVKAGFDYWALGHVHKRQVHAKAPWVVMPGNPQGRDIGEAGAKSATLLTIDNGQIALDEVPTSSVEFRESAVSLAGLTNDDEIRDALRTHLTSEAATVPDCAILRLTLTGTTSRAWQLRRDRDMWAEVLAQLCVDTGRLWIEKLIFEVSTGTVTCNASDAVAEVQRTMQQIVDEDGFRNAARIELEYMLSLLPQSRRATLAPNAESQAALLDQLANDAVIAMAAAMRGVDVDSNR